MNWHVFNRDNPDTYPDIDCPMLIYHDVMNELCICKWDNNINMFFEEVECNKRLIRYFNSVFYQYIGYMPYIDKELHPRKCSKGDRTCEYEDDGYCISDCCECKHIKFSTEYSIGTKRIWREFE